MRARTNIGDHKQVWFEQFGWIEGRVTALIPGFGFDIMNTRGQHFRARTTRQGR